MKILKGVSHLDHGLSEEQLALIEAKFADRTAFFIETFELELGPSLQCALYGPLMGDLPVPEACGGLPSVRYEPRGDRAWPSRILIGARTRPTRTCTVIAGPYEEHECVLYTVYGGPKALQEPGDPACKDVAASKEFWAAHALART